MPITTLFFDLDGTVSNNFDGIARCLNFALKELGLRELSDAEVLPFVGHAFIKAVFQPAFFLIARPVKAQRSFSVNAWKSTR